MLRVSAAAASRQWLGVTAYEAGDQADWGMKIDLGWTNSISPATPFSTPNPDCLCPPRGMPGVGDRHGLIDILAPHRAGEAVLGGIGEGDDLVDVAEAQQRRGVGLVNAVLEHARSEVVTAKASLPSVEAYRPEEDVDGYE